MSIWIMIRRRERRPGRACATSLPRLRAGCSGRRWERAAPAEGVEGGAFGLDGEAGVGMLEESDGVADVCVTGFVDGVGTASGFEGEGSLAGGGTDLLGRETVVDGFGALETVEAGGGEDEGVTLALFEFAEAGVDVAADFDEGDVGAEGEDLGATAGAGGADAAPGGKGVEGPVRLADPDVAGVGAFGNGGEGELRGYFGGEVFKGVDGEVDASSSRASSISLMKMPLPSGLGGGTKPGCSTPASKLAGDPSCMRSPVVRMISSST